MAIELEINFNSPRQKRLLYQAMKGLNGLHKVTIAERKRQRSSRQNAYYWAVPVHLFHQFLNEQGEAMTKEQTHELMKAKFLRETVVNHETGEVFGERVKSTTELSTSEFAEYLDQCIAWLADMFDIVCPDPDAVAA